MTIKARMRRAFRITGFDLRRFSPKDEFPARLAAFLQKFEVDTVLDVGANIGQFASELREAGFNRRIISFEPLSSAHSELEAKAATDPSWFIHPRTALGDHDGTVAINVSGNSVSSSILNMKPAHSDAARTSGYVGTDTAPLCRLDSVVPAYLTAGSRVFLKVDTQGFEWQVLDGAQELLSRVVGVLLEVSLVELYDGQKLWKPILDRMLASGFEIWSIDRGFTDPRDGRTLQCDIVFVRIAI